MTDLILAMGFATLFVAMGNESFLPDVIKSLILVMLGLTLASLLRDIIPQPLFPFDQQFIFMLGVGATMLFMKRASYRIPSFLAALLVLWIILEVLAFFSIGHSASLQDYQEQGTIAYIPALVVVWTFLTALKTFSPIHTTTSIS